MTAMSKVAVAATWAVAHWGSAQLHELAHLVAAATVTAVPQKHEGEQASSAAATDRDYTTPTGESSLRVLWRRLQVLARLLTYNFQRMLWQLHVEV